MKQILLATDWSDYPPIGLLYVANALEQAGYTIRLCSADEASIADILWRTDPLVAGFSVYTRPSIESIVASSEIVKQFDVPVMWGGLHPTFKSGQCLQEPYVDCVMVGDGEPFIVGAVDDIAEGTFSDVYGQWDTIIDLDSYGPSWHLVDLPSFVYDGFHSVRGSTDVNLGSLRIFYYLITSRACLFDCGFCYNSIRPKKRWNCHSVDWVKAQVLFLKNTLKINGIGFWDDLFFGDLDRGIAIIEFLVEHDIKFLCEARPSMLDASFVKWLKQSGCLQVFVGGESGSGRTLALMNKQQKVADILSAAEATSLHNLPARFSFIYGYPGETYDDALQTATLIGKLKRFSNISISGPKLYTPVPGTASYKKALELGFNEPDNTLGWKDIHRRSDHSLLPWVDTRIWELVHAGQS